jgi:hypothetical protein
MYMSVYHSTVGWIPLKSAQLVKLAMFHGSIYVSINILQHNSVLSSKTVTKTFVYFS